MIYFQIHFYLSNLEMAKFKINFIKSFESFKTISF
jgi:hypothetical protein